MPGFVFQKKRYDDDMGNPKSDKLPTDVDGGKDTHAPIITVEEVNASPIVSETGSLTGTVKLSKDHNPQPIQERALLAFKAFQAAVVNLEVVTRRVEELTKVTEERLNNGN